MYYYNNNGRIQTSPISIKGQTAVSITDQQAALCTGFDSKGNPILEESKLVLPNIKVKLIQCEREYMNRLNSGITYNSKVYDSDDKAQKFITSLVTALNAGIITKFDGFTLKDNTSVNLTGEDIKALAGILLAYVDTCHKWKKAKQSEINACTTLAQLEAVTF